MEHHCVIVEPGIDYFKDPLTHIVLEVLPNSITGGLTDPKEVYVRRWMAGRRAGIPEFDPLYPIEASQTLDVGGLQPAAGPLAGLC